MSSRNNSKKQVALGPGSYVKLRTFGVGRVVQLFDSPGASVRITFEDGVTRVLPIDPLQWEQAPEYDCGRARIFTLGYEKRSIEEFLALLCKHKIDMVIDVRRNPVSRKKGFSKSALGTRIDEAGIGYVHVGEWGCPKSLHQDLREGRVDYPEFFKKYESAIRPQRRSMRDFVQAHSKERLAVICFERDPFTCHRNIVGKQLAGQDGGFIGHILD